MENIKVRCIKGFHPFFKEGKEYEAFWDGDGYNEPKSLITLDDRENSNQHIIAEHTLEDKWFKEYFKLV